MFKKLIVSKSLRRHVSWVIAAVLIIPFILFFHTTNQRSGNGPGGTAGVIFGKRIPWQTFEEQRRALRRQFELQLGEIPDALNALLNQYTWDRLILLEEAKHQRLHVSDRELASSIQRISAFQDHGRFVPDRYHRALAAMGTSPPVFERMLRNDLLIDKLVTTLKASLTVTDQELQEAFAADHERLKASLMLFETASFMKQARAHVTDAQLRTYYAAHQEEVRVPDQLTLVYAGATSDELSAHTHPTDEALKTFYDEHPDEFVDKEGKPKPYTDVTDAVRQQLIAEQVRHQLKALAIDLHEDREDKLTFDEMVVTRALRPHTVGPFAADESRLPSDIEPALFQTLKALPEGEIGDVVETPQGTSIGRIIQRIPSRIPTFEEARAQITERFIRTQARTTAKAAAEALRTTLMTRVKAGLRFEEAALLNAPLPVHPVQFSRTQTIPPLGRVPIVNDAAFRLPLGHLSEVIEVPSGAVLIRPEDRLAPDTASFASAAASLREDLLRRKESERLQQWLGELRKQAKLESFIDAPPAHPS